MAIGSCNHTPDNIKVRIPTGTWNRSIQHFKMISAIIESSFLLYPGKFGLPASVHPPIASPGSTPAVSY